MVEKSTQMGGVWGWRGVIGHISPSVYGSYMGENFYKVAPEGVGLLVATLGISRPNDETLEEALTHVDRAAKQLVEGGANYIHLAGPFGIIRGTDWHKEIEKRLEEVTKLPSGTTLGALFDALDTLSVKRLVLVHPGFGIEKYDNRYRDVCASHGIDLVNSKGLGLQENVEARKTPMSVLYNAAREAYQEAPQADGMYISCGAWGGAPVVECLEEDFGKPVVCTHSLSLWAGLKALKIRAPVRGYGMVFETL